MSSKTRPITPLIYRGLLAMLAGWVIIQASGARGIAQASIGFVQVAYSTPQTSLETVSVPYAAAQSAGNLNVVVVGWNDAVARVRSVADTKGNTYLVAIGPTVQTTVATQSIYYAKNIASAAAGGNAVTVTFDRPARHADIRIAEYRGLDLVNPVDGAAAATGSSTMSSSGAVTTTNANDLLVGANLVQTTSTGPGAGYAQRVITSPDGDILEDRVVTATGNYSATAPLSPSGQWVMQIVAFRAAGGGGGAPDTQPPTAPGTLTATGASASQISLAWTASTDNMGVTNYLIERCQGAGCSSFAQVATSTSPSYANTGLAASTSYSYRVRATDAANNLSGYSNPASTTTTAASDTQPPTAPGTLTAAAVSGTQISLQWGAASDNVGVTSYRVAQCAGIGCASFLDLGYPTGTTYNDTGLATNTSFSYVVRATDAAGNLGPYSNVATVTTLAEPTRVVYPLKVSANGRYLLDQTDTPFLIVGDSPQGLITDLSIAEADAYFANRASYGFNAMQIHLLGQEFFGGRVDYSTYDGITPFTTPGDISTPRESYFARVDAMIDLAAQHGIVVFLTAAETIDSLGLFRGNGVTKCRAFGQYLGNRYRNFDNIVWDYGNDFQTWQTASDNAVILAVANGVKDSDSRHLHTVWLNFFVSASRDSPDWEALVDLDFVYTYYATYAKVLNEYARIPAMPVFMGEANYEEESISVPLTTPEIVRRQEYWAMTSGASGSFYGNYWTWDFRTGWRDHYDSPGAAQTTYFRNLFLSRSWWELVPDPSHQVLTAGYGTYAEFGNVASNDYATAALASDSSLMIAYLPSIRTVTVNMSKLSGPVTARWYDPSNGTYSTVAGSPFSPTGTRKFTPAGNNSDGNGDWVLVLETSTVATGVPGELMINASTGVISVTRSSTEPRPR